MANVSAPVPPWCLPLPSCLQSVLPAIVVGAVVGVFAVCDAIVVLLSSFAVVALGSLVASLFFRNRCHSSLLLALPLSLVLGLFSVVIVAFVLADLGSVVAKASGHYRCSIAIACACVVLIRHRLCHCWWLLSLPWLLFLLACSVAIFVMSPLPTASRFHRSSRHG